MKIPFISEEKTPAKEVTSQDGEILVRLARKAIEAYLQDKTIMAAEGEKEILNSHNGVFVTIEKQGGELRGCIGFPTGVKPLGQAVVECAISAATSDPRFSPVTQEELKHLLLEVSVLTPPQEISAEKREDLVSEVKVGRDGLMVEYDIHSGLLLPQVPVQWKWNEEEFLNRVCDKAGLPETCWRDKKVRVFKFQARIFSESTPGGEVKEKTPALG